MRTTETNTLKTIITCGDKKYEVNLHELCEFLVNCQNKLHISSTEALTREISLLTEFVIDGTDPEIRAVELLDRLKFLREIDYLFKGMLYEVRA